MRLHHERVVTCPHGCEAALAALEIDDTTRNSRKTAVSPNISLVSTARGLANLQLNQLGGQDLCMHEVKREKSNHTHRAPRLRRI